MVPLPPLPFERRLAQVAFVVRDIEASAARWAAMLAQPLPEVIETLPGDQVGLIYRGVPSNDRVRLAFLDLGGVQLELLQPIGSDNAWAEGLEEKGERIHHVAFWTDQMNVAIDYFMDHGSALVMRGDFNDRSGEFAYIDGQVPFGCIFELLSKKV